MRRTKDRASLPGCLRETSSGSFPLPRRDLLLFLEVSDEEAPEEEELPESELRDEREEAEDEE